MVGPLQTLEAELEPAEALSHYLIQKSNCLVANRKHLDCLH